MVTPRAQRYILIYGVFRGVGEYYIIIFKDSLVFNITIFVQNALAVQFFYYYYDILLVLLDALII